MNIISKYLLVRRLKRQFYEWDEQALHRHQEERLAFILNYARDKSPYYQDYFASHGKGKDLALSALPEMDKALMMGNFDQINTVGLAKDDLMEFRIRQEKEGKIDLYRGQYSVGLSSGTSGNRGLTVLSPEERELYGCLLWARSGLPEDVDGYRVLMAIRTNNPAYMELGRFGTKLVYVDYTHPVEDLVELINNKKINILAGPPSLLAMLAPRRQAFRQRIKALVSYAEVLTPEIKRNLEEAFQAPVTQIYQGAEGFIGTTCRKGRMHLNEDIILAQPEDAGDELGMTKRLILTDLYRTTQPIIKYAINDLVELSPARCECGSCFRVIDKIHGRADDIFFLRSHDGTLRYLFPDYVQRSIIFASEEILDYQAIQHSPDLMEIRLILQDEDNRGKIEEAIAANLTSWAQKLPARPGNIMFSDLKPERNPRSQKLIRIVRSYRYVPLP